MHVIRGNICNMGHQVARSQCRLQRLPLPLLLLLLLLLLPAASAAAGETGAGVLRRGGFPGGGFRCRCHLARAVAAAWQRLCLTNLLRLPVRERCARAHASLARLDVR
jgi:hypothetical protein